MPWARLDDQILDNPKVAEAGLVGWALYTAGIIYCARNLTDGKIPHTRLTALVDTSGVWVLENNWGGRPYRAPKGSVGGSYDNPHLEDVADHLVELGLWETGEDGCYHVHDYLEYNPSKAQVESEREKARERQARRRAKKPKSRDSHAVTPTVTSADPVPVPVPHREEAPSSSSASLLSEDPVVHTVVARFKEAATDNQHLEVDELKIARVMGEFPGMPNLQRESIHCAEWLGAQNGRKRRVAHLTLRNWLKREQPKEATREPRYTRPSHVSG